MAAVSSSVLESSASVLEQAATAMETAQIALEFYRSPTKSQGRAWVAPAVGSELALTATEKEDEQWDMDQEEDGSVMCRDSGRNP